MDQKEILRTKKYCKQKNIPEPEKLYEQFFDSLVTGGFLILGKSEILLGDSRERFSIYDSHERIYQKSNPEV